MQSSNKVSFDQYGYFEIHDSELLSAIAGGHLVNVDPNSSEGNNCCYNSTCCNEFCVTVANTDLYCGPNPIPPLPGVPDIDRTCWKPNIDCGCPPL